MRRKHAARSDARDSFTDREMQSLRKRCIDDAVRCPRIEHENVRPRPVNRPARGNQLSIGNQRRDTGNRREETGRNRDGGQCSG